MVEERLDALVADDLVLPKLEEAIFFRDEIDLRAW